MKTKLVIFGLFMALLAITLNGVYQDNKYTKEDYEKKQAIKSKPDAVKSKFSIKLGDKEFSYEKKNETEQKYLANDQEEGKPKDLKIFRLFGLICGVLAIGIGALYIGLKGIPKIGMAIIGIGLISVAWEYALYAVGVAVVIVILSGLS